MVFNNKISNNKLIYLTPSTNTDNKVLYVKSKKEASTYINPQTLDEAGVEGYFTVAIDAPLTHDVYFNWWIIN